MHHRPPQHVQHHQQVTIKKMSHSPQEGVWSGAGSRCGARGNRYLVFPSIGKPRQAIVQYLARRKRDALYQARFNLKGKEAYKGLFINEDLTSMRYAVLLRAKDAPHVTRVSTKSGTMLNTGVDTQQSMGPSGQQAGSADRAAPTLGKPGPGNAAPRTCGPVPLPGKPGMGRATPRTRAPVPPPGKPGEGKPETRERRERRYRQRARNARESSRVLAGNPRRGPRSQMGASPAHDDGPPRQRTAPIPDRGHGFPGRKAAPADYGRKVGADWLREYPNGVWTASRQSLVAPLASQSRW